MEEGCSKIVLLFCCSPFLILNKNIYKNLDNCSRLVYTNYCVMGMILINIIEKYFLDVSLHPAVRGWPLTKWKGNIKKKEDDE